MIALSELARVRAKAALDAPFATQLVIGSASITLSYGDLLATAERLTGWLDTRGVKRGDRVALIARNTISTFPLLIACASRGAILAPVNPDMHDDELQSTLALVAPSVTLYATPDRVHGGRATKRDVPLDEALAFPRSTETAPGEPDVPVLLIRTSGSTAVGKGVLLTQTNLSAMAESITRFYGVQPTDRLLCILPTFYVNALVITGMVPLAAGAHTILGDVFGYQSAKFFWQTVGRERITILSLVPSIMKMLLRLFPDGRDSACPGVRFALCGAAPLDARLWREFEARFDLPVYQGYGLTETTCWAVCTPPGAPRRYDTVGQPVDCQVRIQDGEVQIQGPLCMAGYVNAPAATHAAFTSDGFLRTGDLGFFDVEGLLHISGRIKDIIIKNGVNISPVEIDEVLSQHPDVEECRTIGMPDEWTGERIHTVCVPRRGAQTPARELRAWLVERLSSHKRPDDFTMSGWLPRGPTGKVASATLRQLLTGELCDRLVAAWSGWRRARAPLVDRTELARRVQDALLRGTPVRFVLPWGIGNRATSSEADREALEELKAFLRAGESAARSSPALTILFLDVHERINRGSEERIARYGEAIATEARLRGFDFERLSEVWRTAGLRLEEIDARAADVGDQWAAPELRQLLERQAARRVNEDDPIRAARRYYFSCLADREAIGVRFPGAIGLSYLETSLSALLPALPTLHFLPERPWFID